MRLFWGEIVGENAPRNKSANSKYLAPCPPERYPASGTQFPKSALKIDEGRDCHAGIIEKRS